MFLTSLFFLRHLKTIYNRDNIISGKEDSEILSGQRIINLLPTDIKFDVVLCSPLKRCRSTLSLIPNDYMLSIKYMNELSERNMGVLEGISRAEAKAKYPFLFCGSKIGVSADTPNGESIYEVQKRLEVIANYINVNQDKNILICSHNQIMKILYFTLNGILVTNDAWQCINFPNGVLINVSDWMNLQV
ncbi:MAG: histidine phosphatase family protein [Oscillospiraceae bacterium]|nr:histidine phosphatase family protein [Oscillospiraceae bacterium]MDE6706614.1 histidine phosphatase family protein [Oscillospiraceae bacterium]MDE6777708.1 histidine phosphatase family protein [Oscillospiraceae bacterium]